MMCHNVLLMQTNLFLQGMLQKMRFRCPDCTGMYEHANYVKHAVNGRCNKEYAVKEDDENEEQEDSDDYEDDFHSDLSSVKMEE